MTAKLFEEEVGKTLRSLGSRCFYLKPLDGVMWAAERVDFHAVIDGRGLNIEAKEVKSTEKVNWRNAVTPNQLNCLRATEQAGGFGLLLVNFGRVRPVAGYGAARGFMGVFRFLDIQRAIDPRAGAKDADYLYATEAFESVFPLPGGLWQTDWLTRLLATK